MRSGRIAAVEGLVGWDHPERGLLAPDSFIPLIEQHGRAADLTLHVMARALTDAAAWQETGCRLGLAINISTTLLQDGAFADRLEQLLDSSGFPAERITLEVTESAAMADPDAAIVALERWRRLGLRVSIDDYGTGQLSLSPCRRCRRPSSRSTRASSPPWPAARATASSSARPSPWPTSSASRWSRRASRRRPLFPCFATWPATRPRAI
ncbi:MAG TPA: EAL domain-containing protein [Allosphingosinicella sp.]|nr:EAL domain-containing protein [Allosphingosinicella sp.]